MSSHFPLTNDWYHIVWVTVLLAIFTIGQGCALFNLCIVKTGTFLIEMGPIGIVLAVLYWIAVYGTVLVFAAAWYLYKVWGYDKDQ